jgi:hypothetical protein
MNPTVGNHKHPTTELSRHVGADGRGNKYLCGTGGNPSKTITPRYVKFREDVVKYQHRLVGHSFTPKQVKRPESQCQGARPRFAVTCKPTHRQTSQSQTQLVAMRTYQADATGEFLTLPSRKFARK